MEIDEGSIPMDTAKARSLIKASQCRLHSSECSNEESETRVKSREACFPLMPVNQEFTDPADENVNQESGTPSSDAFSGSRIRMPMSPRGQKSIANAKTSSQNAHGEGGKRRSEPPATDQPMDDNVRDLTGQPSNDDNRNGISIQHVKVTRGQSRMRPRKIKFEWQRSAPNNTRQSTNGPPGVERPRWSGRQMQVPRSSPTPIDLSGISPSGPSIRVLRKFKLQPIRTKRTTIKYLNPNKHIWEEPQRRLCGVKARNADQKFAQLEYASRAIPELGIEKLLNSTPTASFSYGVSTK
ncbi:unnamed protein product [Caenorhabditis nigoni]